MYSFKGLLRHLEHQRVVNRLISEEYVLEPDRLANRVIYGTDYHPDQVAFNQYKKIWDDFTKECEVDVDDWFEGKLVLNCD